MVENVVTLERYHIIVESKS